MSTDIIEKYLEEVRKRLLTLNRIGFNGKVSIELNMKCGGVADLKFCPEESVRV